MPGRFGAVLTAMVTPFDDEGALDLDAAVELARWLQEHGNDGLVVAGTTGEAPTLTDVEKLELWRAVSEAVTIPVVAGSGSNDTRHTVEMTSQVKATGAAGVLVQTPYYNRPAQSGIEAHFRAAAASTDLPVLLYDIPIRSARKIRHDVLVRLSREVPNIVGVKDAAGNPGESARLLTETEPGFELYSGDDSLTLPLLSIGGVGVVGVATHWTGPEHQEMIASFEKGDVIHARDVNARLIESFAFENTETSPQAVSTKAMMRTLGLRVGECRLPLGPTPIGVEDRAREVWANLHG